MSDEDLGLDQLSDDQLVELARSVAGEVARRRDQAIYDAARVATAEAEAEAAAAMAEALAAEKRIAADLKAARDRAWAAQRDRLDRIEAAERGVEIQVEVRARTAAAAAAQSATLSRADVEGFDEWSLVRRAAMMIAETLHESFSFHAWRSRTGVRRVYLDGWLPGGMKGQKKISAKIVYHVDGDPQHPPGYIQYEHGDFDGIDRDQVAAIVRYIATCWEERPEIPVKRALAVTVSPAPRPRIYAERIL